MLGGRHTEKVGQRMGVVRVIKEWNMGVVKLELKNGSKQFNTLQNVRTILV